MSRAIRLCCVVAFVQVLGVVASTDTNDFAAMKALMAGWDNFPPNWDGADPCGSGWDGISCSNDRIVSITLASINVSGQLASDIEKLSELQILDLSYNEGIIGELPASIGNLKNLTSLIVVGCGFTGEIPSSVGSLQKLVYLSLNSNKFIGEIPASIGNLSNLFWLDLAENKLTGSIPVSKGTTPGLDMLVNTKHFHFGGNQLSGVIPPQLFSSELTLRHLLLENNQLTGSIPSTLSLVQSLEVIRLDKNMLTGVVPNNLNNLSNVQELFLANNKLTGPLPNLTTMDSLNYVDLSNNSFDATAVPPWFSSLQSLTSLIMENTHIKGQLPVSLFSLAQLQTVVLRKNQINGTLDVGEDYNNRLKLIDLQNNLIDSITQRPGYTSVEIILLKNPYCDEGLTEDYCSISRNRTNDSYETPKENCTPQPCKNSEQISSPTCKCAYPYSGTLVFRAPSFSNYGNKTVYESLELALKKSFKSHGQPVDSVSLSNPLKSSRNYLELNLEIFPSNKEYFNHTGIARIGFMLSNQTFKPPHEFGPFYFKGCSYLYFAIAGLTAGSRTSKGVIIGGAIGGCVLLVLLIVAGVYAFRQKKIAKTASKRSDPFGSWDPNTDSGGVPQLKGGRSFTYEEIKKCTNNFSVKNEIGSGGYGKVYRGTLLNGDLVAIKRAQQGSTQGPLEFKTEIELLSRVHHKNVVSLVGFCFDKREQMLIYEYVVNGTLKDSLTGKTGIGLDWTKRLRIALGAGRGVQYLHELANPPIIHRDIKSNNILLDERLNAKVADFGLSKSIPMSEQDKSHVTTQVKGTMGYLDPEYYMTQQLTDKSDVYSFGVVMLELLTSRTPIVKGKYIVREVKDALDRSKNLYNLEPILDPIVASNMAPGSVERFVDVALRCVEESGVNRPSMSEVAKEIESIMESAGINLSIESASTSDNYVGTSKGSKHPYTSESLFSDSGSGVYSQPKSE